MSGRVLAALIVALLCSLPATPRAAADYPARPVTIVVPFPPGGYTLLLAHTGTVSINPTLYPASSTADEYARDIAAEGAKWGGLVRKLGLKVE